MIEGSNNSVVAPSPQTHAGTYGLVSWERRPGLVNAAIRADRHFDRALTIGGDALYGQHFAGRIDEVRIFNTAGNATEIQSDMNTPIGSGPQPRS